MKHLTLKITVVGMILLLTVSGFNISKSENIALGKEVNLPAITSDLNYFAKSEKSADKVIINKGEENYLFNNEFNEKNYFDKTSKEKTEFVEGEFIVKLKDNVIIDDSTSTGENNKFGITSLDSLNEKNNVISISKISLKSSSRPSSLSNVYKVAVPKDSDILRLADEYGKDQNIEYAEPNYIYQNYSIPNDPLFNEQWALSKIDAPAGWDIETGSSDIVIAITDTGVDYTHPDLASNIWQNSGEIPDNGIDDDGNGYVDDVRGWDFANNDNDPMDDHGHGSHCSGIAAAATNNNIGIAGVAYGCRIMPVKGLSGSGSGYSDDLANCIYYAADNGADVISMSWGSTSSSSVISDAIEYAYSKDVILVAAAGNSDSADKHYPSGFDGVLSISATDENDEKAYFSNYGHSVDVAAPGVHILSTIPNENYAKYSGTSMACPHVAGLVGLILSKDVSPYKQEMVKTMIRNCVDPIISDVYMGTGRINMSKVLSRGPAVAILDSSSEEIEVQGNAQITGIAWGETFQKYVLEYGRGKDPDTWTEIIESTNPADGLLGSFDTISLEDGLYIIKLKVICSDGTYNDSIRIVVNNEINTFTVDDDGCADFTSIQDAMDNSGRGDNVYVYNGAYNESVSIMRSVDLIGEKTELTQINGCILIYSDNLTVNGFTIIAHDVMGILAWTCTEVNISNNDIITDYVGVGIGYSERITIYNNSVKDDIAVFLGTKSFYIYHSDNNTIYLNRINNTYYGILVGYSHHNTIFDNTFDNIKGYDLYLSYGGENILRNNSMIYSGILVAGETLNDLKNDVDTSNKLRGKSIYYIVDEKNIVIPSDPGQVIIVNCSNSNINHVDISNCSVGMAILYSFNITISNNNIANCSFFGLYIQNCSDRINVLDNNFKNQRIGIALLYCSNVHIENNTISDSRYGSWIDHSENNEIVKNIYKDNLRGYYSEFGDNCIISGNILEDNQLSGIEFRKAKENVLRENKLIDCGIRIRSGDEVFYPISIDDFYQDIDNSNSVNGKMVYYYLNQTGVEVPSGAGQIILVNCSYFNISNLKTCKNMYSVELAYSGNNTISKCDVGGIFLLHSHYNTIICNNINESRRGIALERSNNNIVKNNIICNNTVTIGLDDKYKETTIFDNYRAIMLYVSSNNIILDNYLFNNTGYIAYQSDILTWLVPGLIICLDKSNNNLVKNNSIIGGEYAEEHGDYGIFYFGGEYNEIAGNLIKNNDQGIEISSGYNNIFYHNIFINNTENAYDFGVNCWCNASLKEGNYWDDYDGVDADGDGIGDIPYNIPEDNQDPYPLGFFKENTLIVKITKPEKALYIMNLKIRKFLARNPMIIGKIDIEVNVTDKESGVDMVEFYIDGELKEEDFTEPYKYTWKREKISIFKHKHIIKVVAYDKDGNSASDEITVWKFR